MVTDHWRITSVHVKAFKSFGPAGCTFDVPSHLVGIVGPNGCGKSNLLEAICFAAAGSNSVLRLSGRRLQEVSCTDAGSQRPEVHVRLARRNTTHLLEASLAPDGTRSYKIDGKIKSGTQVKEFLKARGIVINGTTVIQQAAVTQLSDNNNAHALAELVAAASGLSSWNLQTAAARQEIARTHKALTDIQANISKVQLSVAAEDAAFKVAAEAAQLEQQLEQQVQDLLRGLGQRQQQLQGVLQERQQDEQQTKESEEACDTQLQHLSAQRKALATQQAEVLAKLDSSAYQTYSSTTDRSGSNGGVITNPTKQLAAAEARVVSLQAAVTARAELVLDLEKTQRLLQQQGGRCSLLQQRVSLKQQEAAGLASSLTAVKSSSDAAAALKQQAQEAGMQAAAVAAALEQQQELVLARQHDVQQAHERLRTLQQNVQARSNTTTTHAATSVQSSMPSTVAEASCAVAAAAAAATAAASAADRHTQQLAGLHQDLLRLQMQVQASERPLTPAATASLLAQVAGTSRALPLHACFRLKGAEAAGLAEQQLEQMLTPLSVIAGPAVLQTLVTASVSDANRVLVAAAAAGSGSAGFPSSSSSRRLKIWPLDNLSVYDGQQQQRMAQQQLGKHAVMLPLDLLEFNNVYQPAMLRVFGAFVIAADDATAAALVERFGLSAVTLQGTVSRKGSMTGGWTGSSGSHAKTFWANKHHHDLTAQQHAACELQLAAVQAQQQQLLQEKAAAESHLAAVQQHLQLLQEIQQVQAEADAAEAAFQQDQQQLQELQTRSGNLKARLLQYQAATAQGKDGGGAPLGTAGSSRGSSSLRTHQPGSVGEQPAMASLQQQLQAEADKAAAAVAAAEQELDEAQEQMEELSACIEALECRLSSSKEPQQQQEELQQALHTVQQLQQQQAADKAAAAALEEHLHQLQQQQLQLDKQLEEAEQQQKGMQQQSLRAVAGVKAAVAALQKKKQELEQALKAYSGTDTVQAYSRGMFKAVPVEQGTAAGSAAAIKAAPTQPSELQLQQLSKAAKQLQNKLLKLDVPELLPGQQEALAARLGQIAGFNEQADALKAAAGALEGQIAQDAGQVHAANDVVFEDIAAGFSQLCSSLLPSLELQLVRTGSLAHDGLQFRFRRLQDDAAAAGGGGGSADASPSWQTNLGQLSGGQRTLVSLAMLLAVARTGSACGLLLLDEIDAALDEVNQARASALLWQLAHDSTSACQIMCVTHNVSFQERCDGFVRATKSAAGHSIPAGQSGEARPDDAGASEGAGGSRRAAKPRRGTYGNARAGQPGAAEGVSKRVGTSRAKKVRFVDVS